MTFKPVDPPADVESVDLVLLLSEWRPTRPIAMRLGAAPDTALSVRAVTPHTFDTAQRAGPSAVLAALLMADGEAAFSSPSDAAYLDAEEQSQLLVEAMRALDIICPLYRRVDADAWVRRLKDGFLAAPWLLRGFASSVDVIPVFGGEPIKREHPERHWGHPPHDLLDGHRLVFRAAFESLFR